MKTHPLKTWRAAYEVTQKALAKEAGIKPPFLSEIESYKKEPSLRVAYNLSIATSTLSSARRALPMTDFLKP